MPILLGDLGQTLANLKDILDGESTRQLMDDPSDVFVHLSSCVHANCNCKSGEIYILVERGELQRDHLAVDLQLDASNNGVWRTDSRSYVFPIGAKLESGFSFFSMAWGSKLLDRIQKSKSPSTIDEQSLEQHRNDKGHRFHWKTKLSRTGASPTPERVAIKVAIMNIDDESKAKLERFRSVTPEQPLFDHEQATGRDEISASLRFPFR